MKNVSVTLTCDTCGITFTRQPARVHERNYCSPHCQNQARRNRITVHCLTCGKAFDLPPSRIRPSGNYCSPECAYEGRKLDLGTPPLCTCGCGQPVTSRRQSQWCQYIHGHSFHGKHHTPEAKAAMRQAKLAIRKRIAKRVTGSGNPMWRNGHSYVYHAERKASGFNNYQRRKVRERLTAQRGNQCEHCGAMPGRLELHHIDHDLFHNTDDNLLLLCHPCHTKATMKFKEQNSQSL